MALRRESAQVAVISLWVVVTLAVMAVGLGHRLSMALRLSGYQKDKLKSLYQAKSGLNLAISMLENDNWPQEDEEGLVKVVDEERKININTASKELLTALLEEYNFTDIEAKVNNMLIWRGDIPDDAKIYEALGYPCKAAPFTNNQELLLAKGFEAEEYRLLKDVITVHSGDKVNINTVPSDTLNIVADSIAIKLSLGQNFAENVVNKIVELRNQKGYFENKADIVITLTGDEETAIFNELTNNVSFNSDNFLIEAAGNAGKIKSRIEAVYNRAGKKIIYWHER